MGRHYDTMLYLLGLGLAPKHLTEEARKILTEADTVYIDIFTNIINDEMVSEWEVAVGRSFVKASRKMLEDDVASIVEEARGKDVVVATLGDPLVATTHISIYLEALKRGVKVRYVPGISIYTVAPSLAGLQHYKFGYTVTVPYLWKDSPSFYERIAANRRRGLHTLILLDLHPEPVTIPVALEALLHWERVRKEGVIELSDLLVGMARIGYPDCVRYVGTVEELMEVKWGPPPHVLVLPGELHPVEEETLYAIRRYEDGRCT